MNSLLIHAFNLHMFLTWQPQPVNLYFLVDLVYVKWVGVLNQS